MIAPFGAAGTILFPPPAEQLEAQAVCPCGWEGSAFVWPLVARLGRMETPIGHPRQFCPDCGRPLDED